MRLLGPLARIRVCPGRSRWKKCRNSSRVSICQCMFPFVKKGPRSLFRIVLAGGMQGAAEQQAIANNRLFCYTCHHGMIHKNWDTEARNGRKRVVRQVSNLWNRPRLIGSLWQRSRRLGPGGWHTQRELPSSSKICWQSGETNLTQLVGSPCELARNMRLNRTPDFSV